MKYPNGVKKNEKTFINYGNRGMGLEEDLEISNNYYISKDIAIVHKKPTPITISKVDYPSRKEAVIKEGYFKTPSTTDYNGIYKGKYIDFEAKETKSKTSFPLKNIHNHQIKHLESIKKHGGIVFLIIRFSTLNKTYLLKIEDLLFFLNSSKKSIPLSFFEEKGFEIKTKYIPRVDYIEIVNKIYFGGKNEKNN